MGCNLNFLWNFQIFRLTYNIILYKNLSGVSKEEIAPKITFHTDVCKEQRAIVVSMREGAGFTVARYRVRKRRVVYGEGIRGDDCTEKE